MNVTKAQAHMAKKLLCNINMAQVSFLQDMPSDPLALRAALSSPQVLNLCTTKENTFQVIWDSGASMCVSPDKDDFVGPLTSAPWNLKLQGIAKGLRIKAVGHVLWSVIDAHGRLRHLKLPAYYAPDAPCRLLSTTVLLQTYKPERLNVTAEAMTLMGRADDPTKGPVEARVSPLNNLPTTTCYRYNGLAQSSINLAHDINAINKENMNLSEPEKELLRWHQRLGHISFRVVQFLFRMGVLAQSVNNKKLHAAASQLKHPPKCAACQYGKQHSRPVPGRRSKTIQDKPAHTPPEPSQPGKLIFVDHFICSTKGRKFNGFGIKNSSKADSDPTLYTGGCIFVDDCSGYIDVQFQCHLNTHETLAAVEAFERLARDSGVIPQAYQTDGGSAFTSRGFLAHLAKFAQTVRRSGSGSHHQNGRAERAIQTIMALARTMMLHAAIHWPTVSDPTLWPMAVAHAVWLWNHLPHPETGLSPHDIWSRTRWPLRELHNAHVFGCPTYVLQKKLSDGHKINRWEARSTRMINLGYSPTHANTVPLVLNPETGSITPQWNIVFDDWFATVVSSSNDLPDFNAKEWADMFGAHTHHHPFADEDLDDADNLPPPPSAPTKATTVGDLMDQHSPPAPLSVPTPAAAPKPSTLPMTPFSASTQGMSQQREEPKQREPLVSQDTSPVIPSTTVAPPAVPMPSQRESPAKLEQRENTHREPAPDVEHPVSTQVSPLPPRRSTRTRKPITRTTASSLGNIITSPSANSLQAAMNMLQVWNSQEFRDSNEEFLANLDTFDPVAYAIWLDSYGHLPIEAFDPPPETFAHLTEADMADLLKDEPSNPSDKFLSPSVPANTALMYTSMQLPQPCAYQTTKKKDPDTLTWNEAMNDAAHVDDWRAAALKEIRELEAKDCWDVVSKSSAKGKIIPVTWVFRRKRSPDGQFRKFKARFCVRGDLMSDDLETFAPVVSWSTVRTFLVLAMTLKWKTVSVDWANAFVQATLDEPLWIHIPRGFIDSAGADCCLKLKKSLYGTNVAPRLWWQHLRKALLSPAIGMKESPHDQCLLYRPGLLMVLYVDDAGLAAPTRAGIDLFVKQLKDLGFDVDIEDDFSEYLGIKIDDLPDGTKKMSQKGLIQKTLKAANMEDCNPNWVPAAQVSLGADPDGEPHGQSKWHYASIVGMLLYIANNTRPDISYAVSSVARFVNKPKKSHASAVQTILRYLKRTQDMGIIVKPDGTFDLKVWVDADFAGLHGREVVRSADCARSRLGYIITLGGVLLTWRTNLIQEICLSTLEAEYVALVNSLRSVIPIRNLIIDLLKFLKLPQSHNPVLRCTVFEDNQGAYLLANNQRITARTKYFCVKWHFFWSYVYHPDRNPDGWLIVEKCPTEEQNADYLTKGLSREVFEKNRQRVQGW